MMDLISNAWGMAGQPGAQGQGNPLFSTILLIGLMFGIMYFLIIRPQKKRQTEHQKFLDTIQKGEEVVTNAGMIGKVYGVADKIVTLEIADNLRIKVLKNSIMTYKKFVDEQPPKAN
jgi:preprotein translocase subunit YajC